MQILQIGVKNSKRKFNVRAKADTGREAAIAQMSAKEKPVLHWNKGKGVLRVVPISQKAKPS